MRFEFNVYCRRPGILPRYLHLFDSHFFLALSVSVAGLQHVLIVR